MLIGGTSELTLLDYAFYNANNLHHIPDKTFSNNTLSAIGCFENCKSLTVLPDYFKLNSNLLYLNDFFKNSGLQLLNNIVNRITFTRNYSF